MHRPTAVIIPLERRPLTVVAATDERAQAVIVVVAVSLTLDAGVPLGATIVSAQAQGTDC